MSKIWNSPTSSIENQTFLLFPFLDSPGVSLDLFKIELFKDSTIAGCQKKQKVLFKI